MVTRLQRLRQSLRYRLGDYDGGQYPETTKDTTIPTTTFVFTAGSRTVTANSDITSTILPGMKISAVDDTTGWLEVLELTYASGSTTIICRTAPSVSYNGTAKYRAVIPEVDELSSYLNEGYLLLQQLTKGSVTTEESNVSAGNYSFDLVSIFQPLSVVLYYNSTTPVTYNLKFITTQDLVSIVPDWQSKYDDSSIGIPEYWYFYTPKDIHVYPAIPTGTPAGSKLKVYGYCIEEISSNTLNQVNIPQGFDYLILDYAEFLARASRPLHEANLALAQAAYQRFIDGCERINSVLRGQGR